MNHIKNELYKKWTYKKIMYKKWTYKKWNYKKWTYKKQTYKEWTYKKRTDPFNTNVVWNMIHKNFTTTFLSSFLSYMKCQEKEI